MTIYKGFSTVNKLFPPFGVTDTELVKVDILNEFYTKRGERAMMPNFGSIIHELIMDPLDEVTKARIIDDVEIIIGHEPRVKMIGAPTIVDLDYMVRIDIQLIFVPQKTADHLYLEFNRNNNGV